MKRKESLFSNFTNIVKMVLEHYIKAAKALGIDIDKIYEDMAKALVREELTRKERKKMRKEMK